MLGKYDNAKNRGSVIEDETIQESEAFVDNTELCSSSDAIIRFCFSFALSVLKASHSEE